jgi:hypothetical protein
VVNKICNKAINEIIEQLIANESQHKVSQSDPNATFQAVDLNVKFVLNIEDKDNRVKPFQMFCNPVVDLK